VSADTMTMIGSSIEADAARITAQVLNLASDKNRTFERHFKDTSGIILRTIADKGHIRETAAPSTIAAERLIFNGRTLGGASDHAGGDHHASDREHHDDNHHALITALSSEHNLNEAQINRIKAVLNSEEWNRETTTLSQTGSLIVQAVVTSLTSGAGSTVTGALMQGMSEVAQAAVSAAVNSIASQVTSQLVTAALTGESPRLDVGSIALNAVKSAVIAGVDLKMDAMIKQAKLGELGTSVATAVGHAGSSTAVYGGRFEDALKANLISAASAQGFKFIGHNLYENPKYKGMNLPPKVLVHGLVGGVMAQISGGDFKSGVIATATAHVIGEKLIGPRYADRVIHGEMSSSDAKQQIDAIASAVAGAVTVMANGGEMSGKDLSASMAMAHSVVDNNYLKGFDAYVEFGQGIIAGGKEKAWEDLKAMGLALASPRQTIEALGKLLSSPEAMKGVAKETYDKLVSQYEHVSAALFSDKAYEGDAAKLAGEDAGRLTLALVEAYGGVKGVTVLAKGVGKAARKGFAGMRQASVAKLPDLPNGYHYRTVGKQIQVVRNPGRKADLPQMRLVDGKLSMVTKDLSDLSKVTPPKGKTFEGTVHRYEKPNRVNTTWDQHSNNINANHRYTEQGEGGVYAGTTQNTALEEVTAYGEGIGRVPVKKDVKLNNVLDLTDPKVRKQMGVSLEDITRTEGPLKYQNTQKIGKWAKENGYDGILAPSARHNGGANIVILKK